MQDFQAQDPAFETRVRTSFAQQQFMAFIGAEITVLRPGFCEIRLPFRPELTQQHGFFHGGIVGTLADNSSGYASYTLMGASDNILTVEYKLNLVTPGEGEVLLARGQVVRAGRTLTIARSDVFAVRGQRETLCATAQATMMRVGAPQNP